MSTASLEMLAKAQHIADYVDENNDLMLNPEKMRALRTLLLQYGPATFWVTGNDGKR